MSFNFKNKSFSIPFTFGILALVFITISNIVEQIQGQKINEIAWLASLCIVISFIIIRFYSISGDKFTSIILESNPTGLGLHPNRYLNGLTISFIVGLIALIAISFNFILGMLIYLVMQLCLIYSFSGIVVYNIFNVKESPKIRLNAIISIIFWVVLVGTIYLVFVHSNNSLIVIPYVLALGTMAHYSWYGFSYTQRSFLFRIMPMIASAFFVFSDALIGNSEYGSIQFQDLYVLIDFTYVINLFFMSQAILFLKNERGESVLK